MPDLSVHLGRGLVLANPLITASGCCGYGLELCDFIDIGTLGGVSVKGISRNPHTGNPPQRITETPAGMLNAIGLQNVGADAFARETLPQLRDRGVTVIVNLWGNETKDFVAAVERLTDEPGIAAFELNISCPNISAEWTEFGTRPELTHNLVRLVRAATDRHLMVKLSPNAGDICSIGLAAQDAGADSLSAINTILGLEVDLKTKKPALHKRTGGLSGPAIRPIGLRCVWQLYKKVRIPIIGIGGIRSFEDALKYFYVGAAAVQMGTMIFVDPRAPIRLIEDLRSHMRASGIGTVAEMVGIAHKE
jgi:dihydroorotate dehydrogenase (NAD+) catalytic subunit